MSSVFTVDPRGMTALSWTQASTPYLEQFGAIPILQKESEWRGWGAALSVLATLAGIVVPNPYDFADWQEWAQRFNESLAGVS